MAGAAGGSSSVKVVQEGGSSPSTQKAKQGLGYLIRVRVRGKRIRVRVRVRGLLIFPQGLGLGLTIPYSRPSSAPLKSEVCESSSISFPPN